MGHRTYPNRALRSFTTQPTELPLRGSFDPGLDRGIILEESARNSFAQFYFPPHRTHPGLLSKGLEGIMTFLSLYQPRDRIGRSGRFGLGPGIPQTVETLGNLFLWEN